MKQILLLMAAMLLTCCSKDSETTAQNVGNMEKMYITIDGKSLPVSLVDNAATQTLVAALQEGDTLPSVRQLADDIGINMHTVNKAYSVLRQEGFVTIDRRRGAIVSLDVDKTRALAEMKQSLRVVLARASCKNVTRQEVHGLVDEIFSEWEQEE